MTALPAVVGFCGVKGRFAYARLTSGDSDGIMDSVPVAGLVVTLTPSPQFILAPSATPPLVIVPEPLVLTTDSSGDLRDVDGNSTAYVIGSDDPDLNPTGWTYRVDFSGTAAGKFSSYSAVFPTGGTIDLATLTPSASSLGEAAGPAAASAAAAAASAAAAAASAEEAAGGGGGGGTLDATYPRTVLVTTGTESRPSTADVVMWIDSREDPTRPDNMDDTNDLWFTPNGATSSGDTEAPSTPTGLSSSSITSTGFTVSWSASTDNVAVTGYQVRLDSGSPTSEATTSHTWTGLTAYEEDTDYDVQVRARDAAGNWSAWSTALTVTTPGEVDIPDPVSRFDFNEGSGTTATSVSGGYTLTDMTGGSPVWGSGTIKTWMRGYPIGSTGSVLTQWSAALDFTLNAAPGSEGSFWLKDGSAQTYFNFTTGRAVKVYGVNTNTSTDLVSLSTPHRLVVTQDATTLKVYLDGTEIISSTEHRDFERSLNGINPASLNMDVNTFRVWDSALTTDQITGMGA